MPKPARTAGPRLATLCGAVSLSVLAHGLALAGWWSWRHAAQGEARISQKRGGLTVHVLAVAPARATQAMAEHSGAQPAQAFAASPRPVTAHPARLEDAQSHAAPRVHTHAVHAPPETPATPTAAAAPAEGAAQATADAARRPAPTSASLSAQPAGPGIDASAAGPQHAEAMAEQPGARFASLFAPVIQQPLGRARWGAAPRLPPTLAAQAQAAAQREQAIAGTRQALMQRAGALGQALSVHPLAGTCDIRIHLAPQTAELRCDDPADAARVAPIWLGALRITSDTSAQEADVCLHIDSGRAQWLRCDAPPAADIATGL